MEKDIKPMILMNVVILFVFQRYCLGVSIESISGYLCEGQIINPPENCDDMLWFIKKSKGDKIEKVGPHFSLKTFRTKKLISFSYIVCDGRRKFIDQEMKNLTFYTTFKIDKGNIKIPGIYNKQEKSGTAKFSKETYEFLVGRLRTLFYYVIYSYHQRKIKGFDDNETYYRSIIEDTPQRRIFLNQMNFISSFKDESKSKNCPVNLIRYLEGYYTQKRVKEILGDEKVSFGSYNDKELKLYADRCTKLMNETSKLFQHEYDKNYVIYDSEFNYNMEAKRFFIFIFYFRLDLKKGRKKQTIKSDDFVFMNSNEKIVYIDRKHLLFYENSSPHNNYVLVDIDQLENNRIKTVIIEKFRYREDIDGKLWSVRKNKSN